jgi:hypothetical protein
MQGREIFRLFKEHQCFPTYNSPSHYGIDLMALALWRKYAPSHVMKTMAKEMETALWEDIAQFYHAGMGNLVGPYARAYGMDMRSYGSSLGLCIWASVGEDRAPFPNLDHPFPQQHELSFAIPLLIAGVGAPAEVCDRLNAFQRERRLERLVSTNDTATAWLTDEIMLGGRKSKTSGTSPGFSRLPSPVLASYPATVHWKIGDKIGWICAHSEFELNAHAEEKALSIRAENTAGKEDLVIRFLIHSPAPPIFALDKWSFPSLTVHVSSNLTFSAPAERGELFEIECRLPNPQQGAFVTLNFQK